MSSLKNLLMRIRQKISSQRNKFSPKQNKRVIDYSVTLFLHVLVASILSYPPGNMYICKLNFDFIWAFLIKE